MSREQPKDLRAGLRDTRNEDVEVGRAFLPQASWAPYPRTYKEVKDEAWPELFRLPAWYGSKTPSPAFSDPKAVPDYEQLAKSLRQAFAAGQTEKKRAIARLERTLEGFKTAKVLTTKPEDLLSDRNIYLFKTVDVQEVLSLLSDFEHVDEAMLEVLLDCAVLDVANGADDKQMPLFLSKAQILVSQAFAAGSVMGRAASAQLSTGPLVVLTSMFTGFELMDTGYQDFWRRNCHKLRVATQWMICKAYAQGVQSINPLLSTKEVWQAGKKSRPPGGGLSWVRIRQAYMLLLPELKFRIEEQMHAARKGFKYPGRDLVSETEMRAWCDVTTFDWYGVSGPVSEEISVSALGALMLGYECEVLIDMCPGTTFAEYLDFVAAGVDVIPHMDTKELAAGAFAAHACGVKDFEGLAWLVEAVEEHYASRRSHWSTRCLDGAAYLMFDGINEGSRQPVVPYGEWRLKAEVNMMAAHEVGGFFRHGKEEDAMSSAMLSQSRDVVSYAGTIRQLAADAVRNGRAIGEPQGYGVTLTGHGYLIFNMMGASSMFRWACAQPLRCDSISKAKKPKGRSLSKGAEKVSHLAARRAERLGISNEFRQNNPHKAAEAEWCVCWSCTAQVTEPKLKSTTTVEQSRSMTPSSAEEGLKL